MEKLTDRVRARLRGTTAETAISLEDLARDVGSEPKRVRGALLRLQDRNIARFARTLKGGYYIGPGDAHW